MLHPQFSTLDYFMRKNSRLAFSTLVILTSILLTSCESSPSPRPDRPIELYPLRVPNTYTGTDGYQLHFYVSYGGVVIADKLFNDGDSMDIPRTSQKFARGKTLYIKVQRIKKSTGEKTIASEIKCPAIRWDGSYCLAAARTGGFSDKPYYQFLLRSCREYKGVFYIEFEAEHNV